MHIAAQHMEYGAEAEHKPQAKQMRQLVCQGDRLLTPPQGAVRVPQRPQRERCIGPARSSRVKSNVDSQGAVLLGVMERNAALEVFVGSDDLSQPDQGLAEAPVGRQEQCRVALELCLLQELFP